MGVVAIAVGVGLGVRVGVTEGVAVGVAVGNLATGVAARVAVGNSATRVAVEAGAHAASSEMLRHTVKSKGPAVLPLIIVFTICRVFFGKILAWDCIILTLHVPKDGHYPPATIMID